jgi:NAD(P)H-dependent FMN reductase
MRILTFSPVLRKGSFNRQLIALAAETLRQKPGVQVDQADFASEFPMPVYDGDVEEEKGIPEGAKKLIERIRAADALVVSTPEYNGGICGVFKNAIDWVSREDPIAFDTKPLLLLGASPGALGAVRGLWHTRVPLEAIGTRVYAEMFGLPRAHQAFDEKGKLKDEKTVSRLDELLNDYVEYARRLSGTAIANR